MQRDTFPATSEGRFISLTPDSKGDPRSPAIQPPWTRENTYIYNAWLLTSALTRTSGPCVYFICSAHHILLYNISQAMSGSDIIQWRLQDSVVLETLTRGLLKVCPKQEQQLQPAQATDGTETNRTKSNKRMILPSIFGIVSPHSIWCITTFRDYVGRWKGRLKEYVQIAIRKVQENGGQEDGRSSGVNDVPPAGERRKSYTINLEPSDFW